MRDLEAITVRVDATSSAADSKMKELESNAETLIFVQGHDRQRSK